MNEKLAAQALGLIFPVDAETLKKQYRKRALETHPDRTNGDESQFKQLSEAYNYVTEKATHLVCVGDRDQDGRATHTIDGTPLSELGLGLGPTVNGKPCEECKGNGYTPTTSRESVPCQHSNCEYGYVDLHAAFPKVYPEGRERRCFFCHGSGYVVNTHQGREFLYCSRCSGTGEIKIYNPVLPKGALAALSSLRFK